MDNVIIVAHKYLPQPDDDLVKYLNDRHSKNVLHIYHSFNDAQDRTSFGLWYKNGSLFRKFQSKDYKRFPEAIIYLKELIFTLNIAIASKENWNVYIGMDGLCVLFGYVLKLLKKINKLIYWTIDFVPEGRFNSKIKNSFYYLINRFSYIKSDEAWDLSPRMSEIRNNHYKIERSKQNKVKIVPYGLWLNRIKSRSYENCKKNTLVFMGHLIEKQGVQLVIKAMPEILRINKLFRFKIIGEGNYKDKLISLAKEYKVIKYCMFMGKINDNKIMEKEIAKSCLSIAPYVKKLDRWTKYADPGKIKTYLACGVPVLLTDIPWNAKEIEKFGCGKIISENRNNIVGNVIEFMKKNINENCRKAAIKYSKRFDWNNIFSKLIQ